MKIEMNKKYTSKGRPVRILAVDIKGTEYPVVAAVTTSEGVEAITSYTSTGRYHTGSNSLIDLVEYHEFMDFKIDEPVMIKAHGSTTWHRRNFAGVTFKGRPLAFSSGANKWTASGTIECEECRRPTEHELTHPSLSHLESAIPC